MRTRIIKYSITTLLMLLAAPVYAESAASLLQSSISTSFDTIFSDLQKWALPWLAGFIFLQFTWTNVHLLLDGSDWEKIWAKFLGSLFWFGICFYTFENGSDFIKQISNFLLTKATGFSGVAFDPSYPIDSGLNVASSLLETLDGTQSILGSLNPFPSIMMGLVSCVILAVSALLAFKVFMIFVETKIVIALSPLSFALLGLKAFRDQGLAPFKYLVSLAYRVMIIAAILTAMGKFSTSIIASFKALPAASDPSVWPPIWAAAIGYAILGALALRSDSIAAMLASGSSNMSPGDSAAVAATAGVAGGVVGGAIGSVVGGAKSAGAGMQSMGDFMKSLNAGGSMKNESPMGAMPVGTAPVKQSQPEMSLQEMRNHPSAIGNQKMTAAENNAMRMAARPELTGGSASPGTSGASANPTSLSSGGDGAVPATNRPAGVRGPWTPPVPHSSPSDAPAAGAGATAGIGGAAPDAAAQTGLTNTKPTLGDNLKNFNDHIAREQTPGVHVTMNTHAD